MAAQNMAAQSGAPAVMHVVRRRSPWPWIAAAIVVVIVGALIYTVATNSALDWSTYGQYFFNGQILRGLLLTLELTAIAMALGIALGTVIASMRLSRNPVATSVGWCYVWVFRGTPTLVQLLIFYDIGTVFPRLSVPFTSAGISTNEVITPLVAAILGLGLNEAAYMAEIIRAGIQAVDKGQREAAQTIGYRRSQVFWRIVWPQALRVIVPPTFNNIIGMLKYSSLVSVTSLAELLFTVERIYAVNFRPIPLLLVASTWYLACTSFLMLVQRPIERYLSRGYPRERARSAGRPGGAGEPYSTALTGNLGGE